MTPEYSIAIERLGTIGGAAFGAILFAAIALIVYALVI